MRKNRRVRSRSTDQLEKGDRGTRKLTPGCDSERAVAVVVFFAIFQVLEILVFLVCDAANVLSDAVADALLPRLALALTRRT